MRAILIPILLSVTIQSAVAQWKFSELPDSLARRAPVILRKYATDLKILDNNTAELAEYVVLSIVKPESIPNYNILQYSINTKGLRLFKYSLYNTRGKQVLKHKLTREELLDSLGFDLLYVANRIPKTDYPVTIEYEYRQTIEAIAYPFLWRPLPLDNVYTMEASLRVSVVDSNILSVKEHNIPKASCFYNNDNLFTYLWEKKDCMKPGVIHTTCDLPDIPFGVELRLTE